MREHEAGSRDIGRVFFRPRDRFERLRANFARRIGADAAGDLAARVKALEDLLPSQSHMMADVGDHFTNLWFAGEAENWPLADFYLAETKSHLRWAVRRIPIRKDNQGQDVNLVNILAGVREQPAHPVESRRSTARTDRHSRRLQGEPDGLLLVSQGGGQTLPAAQDPDRTRLAHHEFRPQGRLAALSSRAGGPSPKSRNARPPSLYRLNGPSP